MPGTPRPLPKIVGTQTSMSSSNVGRKKSQTCRLIGVKTCCKARLMTCQWPDCARGGARCVHGDISATDTAQPPANEAAVWPQFNESHHVWPQLNEVGPHQVLAPVEQTSSRVAPVEQTSSRVAPVEQTSSRVAPVERTSSRVAPVERTSSRVAPVEQTSSGAGPS